MKWVFCLLLVAALASGCDKNDKSTNPQKTVEIWPLKVGNQWTYEDQLLDTAGNIFHWDTTVMLIAKDTVIQGETWYITTVNGIRDPETLPGKNRSDGLWGWDGSSGMLVWKYPATVADTFKFGIDTVTIESIHDTVTVPAGTFVCLNYKWVDNEDPGRVYQYHYLSPGVGWILGEEYYRTSGGFIYPQLRNVLISYSLQ